MILMSFLFTCIYHPIICFRKKKDEDDPRDEIKCSCGMCFGIGGAIIIGASMVIILILHLACMLAVSYIMI